MTTQAIKNSITLPRSLFKKQGVVVLPLKEYERMKEDFEMFQSKKLAEEIERARKEVKQGKVITLEEVEQKLNL